MSVLAPAPSVAGAVRAFLAQWGDVLTLMGQGAADRIRTDRIPASAGKGDRIRIQRIDTDDVRTLRGNVITLHRSRVQVDVFSRDSQRRDNLAQAVKVAMRSFAGPWGGTEIRDVTKVVDQDTYDDSQDASEEPDYRTLLTYEIAHRNTTET